MEDGFAINREELRGIIFASVSVKKKKKKDCQPEIKKKKCFKLTGKLV